MLRHRRELRCVLRYQLGLDGQRFFQKNVPKGAPTWLETVAVPKKEGIVNSTADLKTLVWQDK